MIDDYRNTSDYKKELLIDSGCKEYRYTTLFKKNDMIILSPTVSNNSKGEYIFEICKASLSYVKLCDKVGSTIIFIHIVPDRFIALSLSELQKIRTSADETWDFELTSNFSIIVNMHSSSKMFPVYLMDEYQAKRFLQNI